MESQRNPIQTQLQGIYSSVAKQDQNISKGKQPAISEYSSLFEIIHCMMENEQNLWQRIGKKEDGANEAGEEGGFYALSNNPDIKVFFKQDPIIAKNIGEFIASYVMRELAIAIDFPKECIAQVELAYVDSEHARPNLSGDNVYVASVVYPDFLELYKDAYLAFHFGPYEALRKAHPELLKRPFPQNRPGMLEKDPVIELMIQNGRYQQLNGLLQLSRSVDDPDVHYGNIGIIPHQDPNSSEQQTYQLIEVDAKGKLKQITDPNIPVGKDCKRYKFYERIDSVRIDFGAAFGDDRLIKRSYNQDKLNCSSLMTWITYHPSTSGPPPYFRQIPELVRKDPSALTWLNKIAAVDSLTISRIFEEAISKVGQKYGMYPIDEFADLAGMKKEGRATNSNDLQDQLCQYMVGCFTAFQKNARTYYEDRAATFKLVSDNAENAITRISSKDEVQELTKIEQERAEIHRANFVAKTLEQLIRLDEILDKDIPEENLKEIGHIYTALIFFKAKLADSNPHKNEPQSGITDAELLDNIDAIKECLAKYQFNVTTHIAREKARQLSLLPDKRLSCIIAAMSNPISFHSLGSAEEHLATTGLISAVRAISDNPNNTNFFETISDLLYKQVNRCLAENKRESLPGSETLTLARADAINVLKETLRAQLAYEELLVTCHHPAIAKQRQEVEIMRRKNICILMRRIDDASNMEEYHNAIALLIKERDRIQKCTELMTAFEQLCVTNTTYGPIVPKDWRDNPEISEPIRHYGRTMYNEAGHLIAEMITAPMTKAKDFYDMDVLAETLKETDKAITDPFKVNVRALRANADELSGKPSRAKKIGGIAGLVVTALCGIALTLVVLGCCAAAFPSGGASLLGVPLAVYLFGAATGISLVASVATLFSARRKGVSKVATRIADEVKERQVASNNSGESQKPSDANQSRPKPPMNTHTLEF